MQNKKSIAILLFLSICAPRSHAQTAAKDFQIQEKDKYQTQITCFIQYENAKYISVTTRDRDFNSRLTALANESDEFDDLKFISTPKGIQGIGNSIEQQASGKWKCSRGSLEVPMLLGKEYSDSEPIYAPPSPECHPYSPLHSIMSLPRSCSIPRIVGYQTKRRMLNEEPCQRGGICLVIYKVNDQGKASRKTIGVAVDSLRKIFPYSGPRQYISYDQYDQYDRISWKSSAVIIGADDLDCIHSNYMVRNANDAKVLYEMCLTKKAIGWR